jgi:membrane associated rhomboid family serine protease
MICVVVFIATQLPFLSGLRRYFVYYPITDPRFTPAGLITHMFNHGGVQHLFFNMLALFFFGPNVERIWGPKKFLFYYFICGFGAVIIHILLGGNSAMLGASGAISGVLLAFAMLFPDAEVMLLIPPIPMKAKYLVMIALVIDLYYGMSGSGTNIAHFAHLGGALFGFVMIMIWRKFPSFMK